MRRFVMLLMMVSLAGSPVAAQQAETEGDSAAPAAKAVEVYTVQLTEFRLKSATSPKMKAGAIAQRFAHSPDDEAFDVVETVRLTALQGGESMVQFGRVANVVTGSTSSAGGRQLRQLQQRSFGTLVRVTAEPRGDKVLLRLNYEASRTQEADDEAVAPDMATTSISTMLLVEPGKPVLAGGTSAQGSTFLLVTVEE